jgi:hypothetical protein
VSPPELTFRDCCALIEFIQRVTSPRVDTLAFSPEDLPEDEPALKKAYTALDDLTGGYNGLSGEGDSLIPKSRAPENKK